MRKSPLMETKVGRKIVINGKEYASPDEMPPEIRALYDKAMETFADRDGNQVPDLFEGKGPGLWKSAKQIWGIAREAQRLGVNQVTFSGETTTSTEAPAAPPAEIAASVSLPPTSHPLEPTATGGGKNIFVLIAMLGGALFLLLYFGRWSM
jgi:hypothetical protein